MILIMDFTSIGIIGSKTSRSMDQYGVDPKIIGMKWREPLCSLCLGWAQRVMDTPQTNFSLALPTGIDAGVTTKQLPRI